MSEGIEKIEGVKSVDVSLNEGLAKIQLSPGNKVALEQLRELVRNRGFTPREANVLVKGELVSVSGGLRLNVTGLEGSYPLVVAPEGKMTLAQLSAHNGKMIQLEGVIHPAGEKKVATLEVLDLKAFQ